MNRKIRFLTFKQTSKSTSQNLKNKNINNIKIDVIIKNTIHSDIYINKITNIKKSVLFYLGYNIMFSKFKP